MKPLSHALSPALSQAHRPVMPRLAWSAMALAGFIGPAAAMIMLADSSNHAAALGAIFAIGLMGAGMIAAAIAGRFWIGIVLALIAGGAMMAIVWATGIAGILYPFAAGLALLCASISFAARGVLFAWSGSGKGWLIAVFVVAGEAAIVVSSLARPGMWPDWLLALLPAQWANFALQFAITGTGYNAALASLIALMATAAATLFVAWAWPRRWTYGVMFTTWLAMAALVHHQAPAP